jgi:hypothetical protein
MSRRSSSPGKKPPPSCVSSSNNSSQKEEMGMSNRFGSVVFGYFLIGAAIGVTQLSFSTVFEPPCAGVVDHTLWKHYEVTSNSDYPSGSGFLMRLGLGAARWLPDLYDELIVGDMTFRDYLLGGYRCTNSVSAQIEIRRAYSLTAEDHS